MWTLKISCKVQKRFYMNSIKKIVIQLLKFKSVAGLRMFHKKKKHNWFEILICYWTLRTSPKSLRWFEMKIK